MTKESHREVESHRVGARRWSAAWSRPPTVPSSRSSVSSVPGLVRQGRSSRASRGTLPCTPPCRSQVRWPPIPSVVPADRCVWTTRVRAYRRLSLTVNARRLRRM